jgi:hypothetical protein
VWIWAVAAAAPPEVDADALAGMLQEQLPQLGQQVGRQPVGKLRSGILTRERLMLAMVQPPPHFADRALPVEIPPWAQENLAVMRDQALAVYVPSMQGIYLVKENLEEVFQEDGLPPEMLAPLVRCLVAHEIVHALQHQYGTRAELEDPDLGKGWEALAEGHASCRASTRPAPSIRAARPHPTASGRRWSAPCARRTPSSSGRRSMRRRPRGERWWPTSGPCWGRAGRIRRLSARPWPRWAWARAS